MRRVVIVGGGSAGWLTACYLDAVINSRDKRIAIALIESPTVGRIGVGEATIPAIRGTLARIGIDEETFLREASATFKHGILFKDWQQKGQAFFHPFDRFRQAATAETAGQRWMQSDGSIAFADTVSVQPQLALAGLSPKSAQDPDYLGGLPYAYHMDAEQFAGFLAKTGQSRGIRHIQEDVVAVASDGERISSVQTKSGERFEADLFIDCTGFASLLSRQALKGAFIDYSPWLLCDRAVTMRIPYTVSDQPVRPFTTSTALSAGWRWNIGLQRRRGVGYVYSSQFINDDDAEQELRRSEGAHCEGISARRLSFTTGRLAEPWKGNCVAVGLSSGFIEPLESTGLYLVEYAAQMLCEYFPADANTELLAQRFNALLAARYEECLSFIALHYCISQRRDTLFWQEVGKPERIPPALQELLSLWQHKAPGKTEFTDTQKVFSVSSWEYILYGMRWRSAAYLPGTQPAPIPKGIGQALQQARQVLPPHEAYLTDLLRRR